MTSASDFRGTYSPGGIGPRTRARRNGRLGGLASGIKRRQLAKGTRRTRDGGLGVPHAVPRIPHLSDEKFEDRFRELCELEDRRFHQGGCDTARAVYRVLMRWQDAKGQGFEITNENVSRALAALARPHSRRTVQYTRQRLERMQLVSCAHVKRSGSRRVPGQMDTIRVHILRRSSKHCTPPLRGTTKRDFVPQLSGGAPRKEDENQELTASDPPTSSAETTAASAAEQLSTERGGVPAPPRPVSLWAAGKPSETARNQELYSTDRLFALQQRLAELQQAPAVADLGEYRRLRRPSC